MKVRFKMLLGQPSSVLCSSTSELRPTGHRGTFPKWGLVRRAEVPSLRPGVHPALSPLHPKGLGALEPGTHSSLGKSELVMPTGNMEGGRV